ncbi:Clp protease N-terminal domain-containing protein [Amycolatopsis sp. NPDC088138]|uniref:Clp protease N-terminal domain-containing protein n=1 Tax=Amycolatopsis sp. NPDC088138 TaxID=3363938 RepID=UPI003800629A
MTRVHADERRSHHGPRPEAKDPVRQIAAAERIAGELDVLGDSLIGFFAEMARAEGCSWTDIGAPRDLSRQGAQQRYAPLLARLTLDDLIRTGVLQHFDDSALGCLRHAQTRARRLGHDTIDSGDLLLAILDDPAGLAGTVIRALGADPAHVRAALDPEPDDDQPAGRSRPGISPDARRAIDGAIAEAHGQGVAVAHLFLAVLRAPGSPGGQALTTHGITRPAALAHILGLAGRPAQDPA